MSALSLHIQSTNWLYDNYRILSKNSVSLIFWHPFSQIAYIDNFGKGVPYYNI